MKGGGVPAGEVERCEWVGEKEEEGKPGEAVRRNKWVWKERWSPPMKEDWTSVHESTSIVVKGLSQIRRGPTKKNNKKKLTLIAIRHLQNIDGLILYTVYTPI